MRYENHADVLSELNGPLWTTLEMTSVDGRQKSHQLQKSGVSKVATQVASEITLL
jgi:hypothetical protein